MVLEKVCFSSQPADGQTRSLSKASRDALYVLRLSMSAVPFFWLLVTRD